MSEPIRGRDSILAGDDPSIALLAPQVASALAIWQTLQLELGEAAVWTGGTAFSTLVGRVALWSGASPAIELGPRGASASAASSDAFAIRVVDWSDAEAAQSALADAVANAPGFAAVDLSGRADVIDILLEIIPRWGRLLLAGPPGSPVTIDFYKNVHRKGIVISSMVLDAAASADASDARVRAQLPRARQLLANENMRHECRRLLGVPAATPISLAG